MKISVIIPVKNRVSLLRITLNNVLGQSKQPHEIIVVDDASTDDIDKVINEYKHKVTFTKSTGKGPGAARNTGLRMATGDAIQFFDSDDLMTNNKLEEQAKLLQDKNADFVYGPWVKATIENNTWKQIDVIMQYYPLSEGSLADFVLQGWCNITQTALFKKDFIDQVGFWREDLMTHEDYEYWFRIAKLAKKFAHENKTCVIYRQHQNQITDLGVLNESRWMDGIKAMQFISDGINYKPSIESLWLLKGRNAASKLGYIKNFANDAGISITTTEKLYIIYHKIKSKITRVKGTSWQKMHGVLPMGNDVFTDYITKLS